LGLKSRLKFETL